MLRTLVGVLAGLVFVTGCAGSPSTSHTYDGQVTEVGDGLVCIGAPEAAGHCFVRDTVTRHLRVDDCVQVTYALPGPEQEPGPYEAEKVSADPVPARAGDCPPQ